MLGGTCPAFLRDSASPEPQYSKTANWRQIVALLNLPDGKRKGSCQN